MEIHRLRTMAHKRFKMRKTEIQNFDETGIVNLIEFETRVAFERLKISCTAF